MALSFLQTTGSGTDLTTYTFSAQNVGTAAADRFIICTFTGRSVDGTARTITSVTIGGVTATINCQVDNSGSVSGVACAAVPTGTTGDVVLVWSNTMSWADIALYRCTGLSSATALDSGTSVADPGTDTLVIKSGGVTVGIATDDDGTHTCTWTGLTENFDGATGGGGDVSGAMAESTLSPNVVVTTNLAITADWNAAATRPTFSVATFQLTDTTTPVTMSMSVQAVTVTGGATVSPAVITMTLSIQSPTVSVPANAWTNDSKNTGSWSNDTKNT